MNLYNDDCFNIFPHLEDNSIDLVLCDMPYGTTACKWDTVLDLDKMWAELSRVGKSSCIFAFTAAQPFTSVLTCSNLKMFKYDWIWQKPKGTGFLNAKKQPLRNKEDILVFYRQIGTYNPQFEVGVPYDRGVCRDKSEKWVYGKVHEEHKRTPNTGFRYPKQIIKIPDEERGKQHPTQKPVALMEYLIKTYSNEGDTVLDFCMGSGTTGVACKRLNRNFIGIEKEEKYYEIAKERIEGEDNETKNNP